MIFQFELGFGNEFVFRINGTVDLDCYWVSDRCANFKWMVVPICIRWLLETNHRSFDCCHAGLSWYGSDL